MLTPTGKATKNKSMCRLFLLKLITGTDPSRYVNKTECFSSCGEQLYKFIRTKEFVNYHRTGFGNQLGRRLIIF